MYMNQIQVGYSITLQDAGDDPDILAEIMTEVRDSIGKNGGQKFMQVLRRKAKTLATLESGPRKSNLDNWWDNKLGVRESTVDVQEDGSGANSVLCPCGSRVCRPAQCEACFDFVLAHHIYFHTRAFFDFVVRTSHFHFTSTLAFRHHGSATSTFILS